MCLPSTARAERRLHGPSGCLEKPMIPACGKAIQPVHPEEGLDPAQTPGWKHCFRSLHLPSASTSRTPRYSLLDHCSGICLSQDILSPPCGKQDDCALGLMHLLGEECVQLPAGSGKHEPLSPTQGQARAGGVCGGAIWGVDKPVPVPVEPTHPASSSGHRHRTPSRVMELKGLCERRNRSSRRGVHVLVLRLNRPSKEVLYIYINI